MISQSPVILIPENNSFEGKKSIVILKEVEIGRLIDDNATIPNTIKFKSKVVSRHHARLIFSDGQYYIQDMKSSSGTFLNGSRLSPQGQLSERRPLRDMDVVKLGEDYKQDNSHHKAITFRVKLPSTSLESANNNATADEDYVDEPEQTDVSAGVDSEFNLIWSSLTSDLSTPLKRLRDSASHVSGGAGSRLSRIATKTTSDSQSNRSSSGGGIFSTIFSRGESHSATLTPSKMKAAMDKSKSPASTTIESESYNKTEINEPGSVKDQTILDCLEFIDSLRWESDSVKDTLKELANKKDKQLMAFYRSLKSYPSSFVNVTSKYVQVSKNKQ